MADTESGTSARLARYGDRAPVGAHELGELCRVKHEDEGEGDLILLPSYALPNRRSRRQFTRQIEAVRTLDHTNIIKVRDGATDREEDRPFVATARHPERTLRELLDSGPLDPKIALRLTLDLLNALTHGHYRRLVHGGLSARGIYVDELDGELRAFVSCYALPHMVGRPIETPHGVVRANPESAAPEVLRGQPTGPWSDVYSTGVLLFEMLTGRHPIPGEGESRLGHLSSEPADDLPAGVIEDPALEEAVQGALKRALSLDASDRFTSARAFALALRPGEPERTSKTSWADPEPEGGACSACAVQIPPMDARTWTPQQSDRPFRCAVCAQSFCGEKHWDRQSQTCYSCRGLPLPTPEGPPPADLLLAVGSENLARSRKQTLRALLTRESSMDWMALRRGEPGEPGESESESDEPSAEAKETRPLKPRTLRSKSKAKEKAKEKEKEGARPKAKPGSGKLAKRGQTTSRRAIRPAREEKEGQETTQIKDALIDAWATARREQDDKATRRLGENVRAERDSDPLPKAASGSSADANADTIPRAARPAAARPFGAHDQPLPPVYSTKSAGRLSLLAGGLVIFIVYFGFSSQQTQAELTRERNAARKERDEAKESLQQVQTTGEQSRERADRVGLDLKDLTTRYAELEQKHATTEGKLAQTSAALRDATVQADAAKARLAAANADLTTKAEALAAQTERLNAKTVALSELEKKWVALDLRFQALKTKLDESLGALEASRATAEERSRELLAREAEWSRTNAKLELDLAKVRKLLADARTQLATTGAQLETLQSTRGELKAQIDAGVARRQELQAKADALSARLVAAEATAAKAREELASAKQSAGTTPQQAALTVASAIAAAAKPATFSAPLATLQPLLEAAGGERALLVVQVRCDPTPGFPVQLTARTSWTQDENPGAQALGAPLEEDGLLRFWIDAAQARRLASGAGTVEFVLTASPADLTAQVKVTSATLVASPVSADVKARLRQLRGSK